MYDVQRIGNIIADIEKYAKELKVYSIKNRADLKDSKNYHAASMVLFAILNKVIDLGNEIISAENLGAPNTYQDIMPRLAKANMLNNSQARELNKLLQLRNVLAHFYQDMSEKDLFDALQKMQLVEDFVLLVRKRISVDIK